MKKKNQDLHISLKKPTDVLALIVPEGDEEVFATVRVANQILFATVVSVASNERSFT